MHDVVRDVAQWIASKDRTKSGLGLEHDKILLSYDRQIPTDNFEGMRELKVLSLKASKLNDNVLSLNALESLTDLRVLQLVGFERLEGISALAKLTKLEILCLYGSSSRNSVEKLGKLKNLRVLDMRRCKFLSAFPSNLIRRLVKTEELYLLGTKIGKTTTAILPELEFLPKLDSLSLQVSSPVFPKDFMFPTLQRYQINIGPSLQKDPHISSRFLRISVRGLNVIPELLWNLEFLEMSMIMEKDIKCLTDTTPEKVVLVAKVLQNLKLVSFEWCTNLRVIFQMEETENHALLLSKLNFLRLHGLPDLEYNSKLTDALAMVITKEAKLEWKQDKRKRKVRKGKKSWRQ